MRSVAPFVNDRDAASAKAASAARPASLTATLARLKLLILKNSIFGVKARSFWSLLVLAVTAGGSLFTAYSIATSPTSHPQQAAERLLLLLTSLFGLWVFGPLLVGGVDDSLDPTRLALLPLKRSELRRGLIIGALIGPLPIGTMITLSGVVIGYGAVKPALLVTIAAVIVALLSNLTLARALSVSLAFAGRSRRGKDLSVLLASLGAAAIFLGTQSLRFLSDKDEARILGWLKWLPSGQIATAILDVKANNVAAGMGRITVVAGVAAGASWIWLRGIDRLLVDPDAIRHTATRRSSNVEALILKPLKRWRGKTTVILASKELRYLVRSPQRRSSLIISIVIGTVFALLQSLRTASTDPEAVFGAVVAALFGVHATNNVLGTDAASLWMEQTSGARLRDQLVARSAAASPNLIIPVALAGLALAIRSGGWAQYAMLCAGVVALIGIPLGVGAAVSVLAPFNQPDSGNPYSNKKATNAKSGLISILAVVSIVSVIIVCGPAIAWMGLAWKGGDRWRIVGSVLLTVPYSAGCWRIGLRIAMRIVRDRETELLSAIGGRRAAV